MSMLLPEPSNPGLSPDGLAQAVRNFRPGLGEYLGAMAGEGFWSTSTGQMNAIEPLDPTTPEGRAEMRGIFRRQLGVGERSPEPGVDDIFLSEPDWRASDWYRDGLQYHGGITPRLARSMADTYDDNQYRRWLIDAGGDGFWRKALGFGASVLGSAPAAENFVPFLGPAARAAMVSRFGVIGGRVIVNAGEAMAGTALIEPALLQSQRQFGDDVSFADGMVDVAMAGVFGAALGGAGGAWRRWRDRGSLYQARTVEEAHAAVAEAATQVAEGQPVRVPEGLVREAAERVRGEVAALDRAYDQVRSAPVGPADDPLVRIRPEDIEETIVARGGWKGLGDVEVKGSGWGLVKFIWRHGEESAKPAAERVTKADILAFPDIVRDQEARVAGPDGSQREWVVDRVDGGRVVYVDSPIAGREGRRLVTVYVARDPASKVLSPPRAGSPEGAVAGPPGDTAQTSFARTSGGQSLEAAGSPSEVGSPVRDTARGVPSPPTEGQPRPTSDSIAPARDFSTPPPAPSDIPLMAAASRVGQPAEAAAVATDLGLDEGALEAARTAVQQMRDRGSLTDSEAAAIGAADELADQAESYASAYDAAANCLLRGS